MDVERRLTTKGKTILVVFPLLAFTLAAVVTTLTLLALFPVRSEERLLGLVLISLPSGGCADFCTYIVTSDYVDKHHKWPRDIQKTIETDGTTVTMEIEMSQDLALIKKRRYTTQPKNGVWKFNTEIKSILDLKLEPDACKVMLDSNRIEEIIRVLVEMADNGKIEQGEKLTTTDIKAMISIM